MIVTAGLYYLCGFQVDFFRPNFSFVYRMGRKRFLIGRGTCILHRKGLFGNFMA